MTDFGSSSELLIKFLCELACFHNAARCQPEWLEPRVHIFASAKHLAFAGGWLEALDHDQAGRSFHSRVTSGDRVDGGGLGSFIVWRC